MSAIIVKDLRKSYGDLEAVAGISFDVDKGEVFALLGPNGAGKTTTVEILEGFRRRTEGEVSVLGYDPARGEVELKRRMGIVLQSTGVDPYLTVRETVEMYRGYFPRPRPADEVIDLVGLKGKRNAKVSKLSGGQQRRLDVAIALAGDPELLFLDEPTTGFDPGARRNAWQIVGNLAALGKTVFLTTHYMDEAQELADKVAVIAGGRIVAMGTPDTIGGRNDSQAIVRFRVPVKHALPEAIRQQVSVEGGAIVHRSEDPTRFLNELTNWSLYSGVPLRELSVTRPTLEDIYLKLTGEFDGTGRES